MQKQNKGYLLLLLLVLTGLAGRMSVDTISGKERRFLLIDLKESRNNLFKTVKDLSGEQLTFKAGPDKWSIKECVQHIALAEDSLWTIIEATLKETSAKEEKHTEVKIPDQHLLYDPADRNRKLYVLEKCLRPEKSQWKTTDKALAAFKEERNSLIKYTKTTTDNLRDHVSSSSLGPLDAYQLMVLISSHTKQHIAQIEEIKAHPHFPQIRASPQPPPIEGAYLAHKAT